MPDETKEQGHPLDRQNAIERDIQLKGSKDPDNFKMPDGRTLSEVRKSNEEEHHKEFLEETKMVARRTREQSIPQFHRGESLAMTRTGNIVDTTVPPEVVDNRTFSKSRTTMEDIEAGAIKPHSEMAPAKSMEPVGGFSSDSSAGTNLTPPVSGKVTGAPVTPAPTPASSTTGSTPSTEPGRGSIT